MNETISRPRFTCKPRCKGTANLLRKVAFNIGNSPSQTDVKIISCIPIDVTDFQGKIATLEKKLAKYRRRSKGDRGSQGSGGSGSSSSGQGVRPCSIMELQRKIERLEKQLLEYGTLRRVCVCNKTPLQYPQVIPYPVYPPPPQYLAYPPAQYPAYPQGVLFPAYPQCIPYPVYAQAVPYLPYPQATPTPYPALLNCKNPTVVNTLSPKYSGNSIGSVAHITYDQNGLRPTINTECPVPNTHGGEHTSDTKTRQHITIEIEDGHHRSATSIKSEQSASSTISRQTVISMISGQCVTSTSNEQSATSSKNEKSGTRIESRQSATSTKDEQSASSISGTSVSSDQSVASTKDGNSATTTTCEQSANSTTCEQLASTSGGQSATIMEDNKSVTSKKSEQSAFSTGSGQSSIITEITIYELQQPAANTEAVPPTANTEAVPPTANTEAVPPTANTAVLPTANTEAGPPTTNTNASGPTSTKGADCPAVQTIAACPGSNSKSGCGSTNKGAEPPKADMGLGQAKTDTGPGQPKDNTESGQPVTNAEAGKTQVPNDTTTMKVQHFTISMDGGRHPTNRKARKHQKHPHHVEDGQHLALKPVTILTSNSHQKQTFNCILCNKRLCNKYPRPSKSHKTLDRHIYYYAQPYSSSIFCQSSMNLSCHRKTPSPDHVSSTYLKEVTRKQFKSDRLAAILSTFSHLRTPPGHEEDTRTPDGATSADQDFYSYIASQGVNQSAYTGYIDEVRRPHTELLCDGFPDVDRHSFSQRPVDSPAHSCSYSEPSSQNQSAYYDDNVYDLVPVRDIPRSPKVNSPSRNTKDRMQLQLKTQAQANVYSRLPVKKERKILPKKAPHEHESLRRMLRHNLARKLSHQDNEASSLDFSCVYRKPYAKSRKRDQHKEAECVSLGPTHIECQTTASKSIQLEPGLPAHGRTEDTLQQIKSILQSVLTEVKQGPRLRPQGTGDSEVDGGSPVSPAAPSGSPPTYQLLEANDRMHTYPLLDHSSDNQGSCCFPTPNYASSSCAHTKATDTDQGPANQRSEATEKFIKEIYNPIAVSMQTPPSDDANARDSTNSSATQLPCAHTDSCNHPQAEPLNARLQIDSLQCEDFPLHGTSKSSELSSGSTTVSDPTTTKSQHKKKNGLFTKIWGLFKWNYRKRLSMEMESARAEMGSTCNVPLPAGSRASIARTLQGNL